MKRKNLLILASRRLIISTIAVLAGLAIQAQVVMTTTATCSTAGTCGAGDNCGNAANLSDGLPTTFATLNTAAGSTCTVSLKAGFAAPQTSGSWAGMFLINPNLNTVLANATVTLNNTVTLQTQTLPALGLLHSIFPPFIGTVQFQSTFAYNEISLNLTGAAGAQSINAYFAFSSPTLLLFPLPIELSQFDVRQQDKDALVTWRTVSETNSDRFEIEQSIDGITFSKIGEVKAAGNSNSIIDYSFVDMNIGRYNSNTIYYRMKQVDEDGLYWYGPIRKLKSMGLVTTLRAYPIPFNTTLSFDIPESMNGTADISLTDVSGRVVYRKVDNISGSRGGYIINDLGVLPGGIYILSVKTPEETRNIKVVKQ